MTFQNGIYVFMKDGGNGFSAEGNNKTIIATDGVLFYNTCEDGFCGNANPNPPGYDPGDVNDPLDHDCGSSPTASGRFYFAGQTTINVTPYGAPYANIAFFQDPCSVTTMEFKGQGVQGSGSPPSALYGKSARLEYEGNASGGLQFVADNVRVAGNGIMNMDAEGGATAGPAKSYALVE
jgi:hypothetical protein